jgi:hypothetical protein
VAIGIRLKKRGGMRKIFAGFLMTVMMLSGCGVAKNLEGPGSKPAPTPEDYGVVWFGHHFSQEEKTEVVCWGIAGTIVVSTLVFFHFIVPLCPLPREKTPAPANMNIDQGAAVEGT